VVPAAAVPPEGEAPMTANRRPLGRRAGGWCPPALRVGCGSFRFHERLPRRRSGGDVRPTCTRSTKPRRREGFFDCTKGFEGEGPSIPPWDLGRGDSQETGPPGRKRKRHPTGRISFSTVPAQNLGGSSSIRVREFSGLPGPGVRIHGNPHPGKPASSFKERQRRISSGTSGSREAAVGRCDRASAAARWAQPFGSRLGSSVRTGTSPKHGLRTRRSGSSAQEGKTQRISQSAAPVDAEAAVKGPSVQGCGVQHLYNSKERWGGLVIAPITKRR